MWFSTFIKVISWYIEACWRPGKPLWMSLSGKQTKNLVLADKIVLFFFLLDAYTSRNYFFFLITCKCFYLLSNLGLVIFLQSSCLTNALVKTVSLFKDIQNLASEVWFPHAVNVTIWSIWQNLTMWGLLCFFLPQMSLTFDLVNSFIVATLLMYNSFLIWLLASNQSKPGCRNGCNWLSMGGNENKGGGSYCKIRSILVLGNELKRYTHLAGQILPSLDNIAQI